MSCVAHTATLSDGRLDQYVHLHPNHLCVVGLAPTHAALTDGRTIISVQYGDLGTVTVSGKKKRGSHHVTPHTLLCMVVCDDGTAWPVTACVHGSLIEVNNRAVATPAVVTRDPRFAGYLAIVQPKHDRKLREDLSRLDVLHAKMSG